MESITMRYFLCLYKGIYLHTRLIMMGSCPMLKILVDFSVCLAIKGTFILVQLNYWSFMGQVNYTPGTHKLGSMKMNDI